MTSELPLVLHVHTLPWVGGSGLNTLYSMKFLDSSRFETAMACAPGGRLEDLVVEEGFAFHAVPHLCAEVAPLSDLRALRELEALLRELKPAIVHTHNSKAGFLGRLAAHRTGIGKVVHTVHGFSFHDSEPYWRRRLFILLEKLAWPWADRYVSISPTLAEWGARVGLGRREDYEIVWSGIETERFRDASRRRGRELLGLSEDVVAIGLVSKLWEGKGHAFAIEVLKENLTAGVKLVFIGEGPLEPELRKIANEHVVFAGFQSDIPSVTAALDIAILPSDFEGMGRVLLEAQAAGVPVVANEVGGMPDVVKGGGFLLPRGDRGAWREAVLRLVNDPALRRRLGEKGRQFVDENFNAKGMAARLQQLYEGLLS